MIMILRLISILIIFQSTLFLTGCSVGALVKVKAPQLLYPVSHTDSFYSANGILIQKNQYKVNKEFSFSITRWGVALPFDIERSADISKELSRIIERNKGDAIIDLKVSVSNPPINGFMLFVKTVSFWTALAGAVLTITEPSPSNAFIAAGSVLLYMFTPAAADISFAGKVVQIRD